VRESGIEPSAVLDSIADLPELLTLPAEARNPGDPPGAAGFRQ